jgi:tetratricopeptide (TPR) repeat protein
MHPNEFLDSGEYGVDEDENHSSVLPEEELEADDYMDVDEEAVESVFLSVSKCSTVSQESSLQCLRLAVLRGEYSHLQSLLSATITEGLSNLNKLTIQAECYKHLGDFENALILLLQAHRLDPGNVFVLCQIAMLNQCMGSTDSLGWCSKACELAPSSPVAWYTKADITYKVYGQSSSERVLDALRTCLFTCVQVEMSQPLTDAMRMYLDASQLAIQLGGEEEMILRAILRAISIAEHNGALKDGMQRPAVLSQAVDISASISAADVRTAEVWVLRELACEAFHKLGQVLEETGKHHVLQHIRSVGNSNVRPTGGDTMSGDDSGWQKAKSGKKSSSRRQEASHRQEIIPGRGYLQGACSSYWMCCCLMPMHERVSHWQTHLNRLSNMLS